MARRGGERGGRRIRLAHRAANPAQHVPAETPARDVPAETLPRTLPRARKPEAESRALGVWIAVGWIAAFLLVWPRLGTVLSVPLLVVGLMWLTGERSWRTMVSVPLAFAGFIYLVFMVLLGVPLPAGF